MLMFIYLLVHSSGNKIYVQKRGGMKDDNNKINHDRTGIGRDNE